MIYKPDYFENYETSDPTKHNEFQSAADPVRNGCVARVSLVKNDRN